MYLIIRHIYIEREKTQSLTAFLGSYHAELLCSVAAAQELKLLKTRRVKVDLQPKGDGWRRGEMSLSTRPPHLSTELPAQLHHPQSWHSDTVGVEGK